jgi:hypothetical protein
MTKLGFRVHSPEDFENIAEYAISTGTRVCLKTEELLTRIINEWDPLALLAGGAPSNEYDIEVKVISKQVNLASNETQIAQIIYTTFRDKTGIELNLLSCLKCAFQMVQEIKG